MTDTKPPRKQKQKEYKSQPAPAGTERLKTIVRRLPPNLPEEIFWQSVQAWVTDDSITWKSYFPGKFRTKRMNREGIPSRAYIAFKNEEQVATFSREYDGHVFRDKAGNESQAIVEFAPFQKIPSEKKKVDARTNTIDKDEDYLSFLETLKNANKSESLSLEALIAASQPPPPPTTTPLLEALKAEKSAQKDKEAILRNHAHYKDAGVNAVSSKKEDAKKKAAVVAATSAQAAKLPEPPVPSSRKGKKAAIAAAAAAAAHKPSTAPAQDGQGGPTGTGAGKTQPASAASSTAKPPPPPPSIARHRPPKELHGRAHPGKSDTSVPSSVPATSVGVNPLPSKPGPRLVSPAPAITATETAPLGSSGSVQAQTLGRSQGRKNRPVIGLGRHFEAALSGAGVGVTASPSPGGDRKRREKGGEAGAAAMTEGGGGGGGGGGRTKHREEGLPGVVVPSALQLPVRPEVGGASDVVIMQRPQSPKVESSGPGPGGEGSAAPGNGAGPARGGPRRGRGRGRGGHRGG